MARVWHICNSSAVTENDNENEQMEKENGIVMEPSDERVNERRL